MRLRGLAAVPAASRIRGPAAACRGRLALGRRPRCRGWSSAPGRAGHASRGTLRPGATGGGALGPSSAMHTHSARFARRTALADLDAAAGPGSRRKRGCCHGRRRTRLRDTAYAGHAPHGVSGWQRQAGGALGQVPVLCAGRCPGGEGGSGRLGALCGGAAAQGLHRLHGHEEILSAPGDGGGARCQAGFQVPRRPAPCSRWREDADP
mmetsp:Transcript_17666/g.55334  ORF Transcript_17666/g.55334 Transcript_17666/m.55334 type:complete len:208 (+) Transcript_17666:64-687(+)